ILPTNMGANFYNQGIDIKHVASNVFGVMYMLSSNELQDISQLEGEVVYNLGQGNTPDFVFKRVLEINDIEYVEQDTPEEGKVALTYAANAQNLISMMIAGQIEYAILGEPQVSQAINATQDEENPFQIVMNLQDEWTNGYPQVSTVARDDLIENHSDFLDEFLAAVQDNVEWVVANSDDALSALTANGSNLNGLDTNSVTRCNINFVTSANGKEDVEEYLQSMYNFDEMFVGGQMPDEGFYRQ
ncbi:MAG: ABC transporter substrate-binding protein, partial [Bacillota bacterium]